MPARTTHLLYLHGFRSSPQSAKARAMAQRAAQHPGVTWWCPQLPRSPQAAAELLHRGTAHWPRASMAVVGSSLGGFYASWLAAQTGCRAVLLNPAVHPERDLRLHLGTQTQWHRPEEHFFFQPIFIDQLAALQTPGRPDPAQLLVIVAKGDEVLDWREMQARYRGAQLRLIEGSDHALSDFSAAHLEPVCDFLQLA